MSASTDTRATLIGLSAVGLWSTAATLTALTGAVPPFQTLWMSFVLATVAGLAFIRLRREPPSAAFSRSPVAWAVGLWGLFGFHAAYYTALKTAPVGTASLVNYTWPLLMVVFTAFLPGERFRPLALAGALLGFGGTALLLLQAPERIGPEHVPGLLMACVSALSWSTYSILSRRLAAEPTETLFGYCIATALLGFGLHLLLEETVWPAGLAGWVAMLVLGLGPMGFAFFLWDIGVKRGNIALLGAAAYLAPVVSTALLMAFGLAPPSAWLAIAALAIVAGSALAARR